MRSGTSHWKNATAAACACALLLGCASIGPSTITRDRFDYVTAISESLKKQVLLNLLKVRYADAPVFMDVSSVINSYSLESEVNVGGQIAPRGRSGDTFGSASVTGTYTDKPTITYQPLAGDKFARSVMAPLPITGILYLIQSGYPADFVLRICVNTINGLENEYGGYGAARPGSSKFRELMSALRQAQIAEGTGFRIKSDKDAPIVVMFARPANAQGAAATRRVRELLGLDMSRNEFSVVYGSAAQDDTEIAVLTRSILQVMQDLASHVDVPAADIAQGRVYGVQRSADEEKMFPALLAVRHGDAAPDDAFTSVRYRNQWFWIDDDDQASKHTLGFLLLMFALSEGATPAPPPVVTVPVR